MEFEAVVRGRCSVRHYRDEPLSRETIDELVEEASWAPSGGNLQPWRVLILEPSEVRLFLNRFESDALDSVFPAAKLAALEAARREGRRLDTRILHEQLELGLPAHLMSPAPPSHLLVVYTENETLRQAARLLRSWVSLFWFRVRNKPDMRSKVRYSWLTLAGFPAFWESSRRVRWVGVSGFVHTLVLSAANRGIASCIHASFNHLGGAVKRYLGLRRNQEILAIVSLGYAAEPPGSPRTRWKVETRVVSHGTGSTERP